MALSPTSTYPTTIDSAFPKPESTDKMNDTGIEHDLVHQLEEDAIEHLEAKVGADSSAVTTSHDYKLSGVTGSDVAVSKAGTETLTNKTIDSDDNTVKLTDATITDITGVLYGSGTAVSGLVGDGTIYTAAGYIGIDTDGLDPTYARASGWTPAGETWTYASADDPTYTFTITGDQTGKYSAGMKIKCTNAAATVYGIITKVAYSSPNTTVTMYGGTDYNLADSAITNPYYSCMKAPQGFPLDPTKWTVEVTDTTQRAQASPVVSTWYNLGSISISIPIGTWAVSYRVAVYQAGVANIPSTSFAALSTANNSESDPAFCTRLYVGEQGGIAGELIGACTVLMAEKKLNLATKTTYYLNVMTDTAGGGTISFENSVNMPLIIRAICAYL